MFFIHVILQLQIKNKRKQNKTKQKKTLKFLEFIVFFFAIKELDWYNLHYTMAHQRTGGMIYFSFAFSSKRKAKDLFIRVQHFIGPKRTFNPRLTKLFL